MTLFESAGCCPLLLWTDYYKNGKCIECPMEDGVDVGIGWMHHCGNECRVQVYMTEVEE